jgi:hypothetical protein
VEEPTEGLLYILDSCLRRNDENGHEFL